MRRLLARALEWVAQKLHPNDRPVAVRLTLGEAYGLIMYVALASSVHAQEALGSQLAMLFIRRLFDSKEQNLEQLLSMMDEIMHSYEAAAREAGIPTAPLLDAKSLDDVRTEMVSMRPMFEQMGMAPYTDEDIDSILKTLPLVAALADAHDSFQNLMNEAAHPPKDGPPLVNWGGYSGGN